MRTPLHSAVVLLLISAFSAFAQSTTPSGTQAAAGHSVAEIVARYKSFRQMTKSVVLVNPDLAMLCREVSKEEMDSARRRFGPHATAGILIS